MEIDQVSNVISEYPEDYCLFLEAAYGTGMMSEGGAMAIDRLFSQDDPSHKALLDIGFGLGGVAVYLAKQYQANISGIEINPWMVKEASKRLPASVRDKINFFRYHPQRTVHFEANTFDIVYSKGVLVHLHDKHKLFSEVNRILKPGGVLLIDDWLSPRQGSWGERITHLCEVENLSLYAETESCYQQLLQTLEFSQIQMRDENTAYYRYNCSIVRRLLAKKESGETSLYGFSIDEAINTYQAIADAMLENELLIRWIRAVKPS